MTSPNMLLPIPSVLVTTDPLWAEYINDSLELIDAHDHSPGKGVQITPAGLNINADLPFNENDATELRTVRFADQASTPAGLEDEGIIYMKNGEFCYKDLDDNEVQLTLNGTINVSAGVGVISGLVTPASASYSTINGTFSWLKDTSKPAKMIVSDLIIYEFDDAAAFPVTIKAENITTAYSLLLPVAIPIAGEDNGVITVDYGGQLIATDRIALSRLPQRVLVNSPGTAVPASAVVYSDPSGIVGVSNTTPGSDYCNLVMSAVPANSTILLEYLGDPESGDNFYLARQTSGTATYFRAQLEYSYEGGSWTTICQTQMGIFEGATYTTTIGVNPSIKFTVPDGEGEYAFRVRPYVGNALGPWEFRGMCLHARVL